jgi:hypothetical protein
MGNWGRVSELIGSKDKTERVCMDHYLVRPLGGDSKGEHLIDIIIIIIIIIILIIIIIIIIILIAPRTLPLLAVTPRRLAPSRWC